MSNPLMSQSALWMLGIAAAVCIALLAQSRNGRWVLLGVAIACLTACLMGCKPGDTKVVTETRPPATVIRKQYVPIPKELTQPLPVKEGPLSEVIDVARDRKDKLIQCNGRLEDIGKIQGTAPC